MDTVEEYMEAHDMQRQDALEVIEEFSDEIAKMRGKCIDIGCGPGSVTRQLLLPKLPADASVVGKSCGIAFRSAVFQQFLHY